MAKPTKILQQATCLGVAKCSYLCYCEMTHLIMLAPCQARAALLQVVFPKMDARNRSGCADFTSAGRGSCDRERQRGMLYACLRVNVGRAGKPAHHHTKPSHLALTTYPVRAPTKSAVRRGTIAVESKCGVWATSWAQKSAQDAALLHSMMAV